jgi:hypothetical protein
MKELFIKIFKSEKKNNIKLVSDNTNYAPYDVPLSEIREIWKAKGFMSFELPIPASENDVKKLCCTITKRYGHPQRKTPHRINERHRQAYCTYGLRCFLCKC